jgi:hypothetical protein
MREVIFCPLPLGEGIKGRVEPFLRFFVYTIRLFFNSQSPSPNPLPSRERVINLISSLSSGRD